MKNNSERHRIFLSALLHDIGKLVQRAQENPKDQKHSHWGYMWIRDNLADKLSKIFGKETTQQIITDINCHHDDTNYITIADCISSGMDRIGKIEGEDEENSPANTSLESVFSKIELKKSKPQKHFYGVDFLDYTNLEKIFPTTENTTSYTMYRNLLVKFEESIKDIPDNLSERRFIETIYYLLEKYTWCIPSAVYRNEPDVSLFDHLKTTAAIAICLYDFENSNNSNNDKEFLLVSGDISGIQNFIYKITQSEGVRGISKMLRGRSFYVSLIADIVAEKIISEVTLYSANILFCSGGMFQLLLPNTMIANDKLDNVIDLTNNWLMETFTGELSLIVEKLPLSRLDIVNNYSECLAKLNDKITCGKKQKFKKLLFQNNIECPFVIKTAKSEKGEKLTLCRACNLTLISKTNEPQICAMCETHKKIGEWLTKTKVIVYAKDSIQAFNNFNCMVDFDTIGKVYLLSDHEINTLSNNINDENIIEIRFVNTTEIKFGGFCFLGNTVPLAKENISFRRDSQEDFDYNEGEILDFETIAYLSTGDKHLGLLKMDVDHLGLIFSLGLESTTNNSPKLKSISRISNISRMINWFFSGYVNKICDMVFECWHKETNCEIKDKISQIFYISYSGGDDLLIIGPWSEIPKLAKEIRSEFKKFTCNNNNIDLSAGVVLVKPKFPMGKAAILCREELEKSKKHRGSITIFGDTVMWQKETNHKEDVTFDELLEFGENLFYCLVLDETNKKLPRKFLHDLITKRDQYIRPDGIDLNYIPFLIYKISRNINKSINIELTNGEEKNLREYLWQKLISDLNSLNLFKHIKIPASYALLKSRKRRY